jgi:hypothetical protein
MISRASIFATAVALAATSPAPSQQTTQRAADIITAANLRADLFFPASDDLAGRSAGSLGDHVATDYIAAGFMRLGLKPVGDNGTCFQNMDLIYGDLDRDRSTTGRRKPRRGAGTASGAWRRKRNISLYEELHCARCDMENRVSHDPSVGAFGLGQDVSVQHGSHGESLYSSSRVQRPPFTTRSPRSRAKRAERAPSAARSKTGDWRPRLRPSDTAMLSPTASVSERRSLPSVGIDVSGQRRFGHGVRSTFARSIESICFSFA